MDEREVLKVALGRLVNQLNAEDIVDVLKDHFNEIGRSQLVALLERK